MGQTQHSACHQSMFAFSSILFINLTSIINDDEQKIIPNYFKLQQAQTESDQDAARKELNSALHTYAKRVKGPYFAGIQWTAVDGALAPFVRRLYILEKHRNFDEKEVGEGWWEYRERLMGKYCCFLPLFSE